MRMSRRLGLHVNLGMNPDSVAVTGGGYMNYITTQASDYDNLHQPLPGWQSQSTTNWAAYLGVNGNRVPHALLVHFKTGKFNGTGKKIAVQLGLVSENQNELNAAFAICSTDANGCAVNHKKYIGHISATPPSDDTIICSGTIAIPYATSRKMYTFSGEGKFKPETWYCIYVWPSASTTYTLRAFSSAVSETGLINTVSN